MTADVSNLVDQAVEAIRKSVPGFKPRMAMVAGSGLGALADLIESPQSISYADIPGFPKPGVHGHRGQLVVGNLGPVPVACMQGRVHIYEGPESFRLKVMIRTMKELGCEILFLTNAAGSLILDMGPGSLVMIDDHINFMGTNPLVGANDDRWGPRFVDLEECWDPDLRAHLLSSSEAVGVPLHRGVYAGWMGPAFETPAEIRMVKRLGADIVGMSTVPDNIVARHCGLRCVGVSVITNFGCGLSPQKLSHDLTLAEAEKGAVGLAKIVRNFVTKL